MGNGRRRRKRSLLLAVVDFLQVGDYVVDQAVFLGLFGRQEAVPVHVLLDRLDRLPGMLGVQLVELAAQVQDLARLDLRSEEHTSELQSQSNLVCRLLLEKKKKKTSEILSIRR